MTIMMATKEVNELGEIISTLYGLSNMIEGDKDLEDRIKGSFPKVTAQLGHAAYRLSGMMEYLKNQLDSTELVLPEKLF